MRRAETSTYAAVAMKTSNMTHLVNNWSAAEKSNEKMAMRAMRMGSDCTTARIAMPAMGRTHATKAPTLAVKRRIATPEYFLINSYTLNMLVVTRAKYCFFFAQTK
jgi:hypothetical protein